jgi:hypothetical protein
MALQWKLRFVAVKIYNISFGLAVKWKFEEEDKGK